MKKNYQKILIGLAIIFGIYQVIALTGIFRIYNNATIANEPNLKINSKMIVSNLIKPKNGDFICYEHTSDMFGHGIQVHRLMGIENDTIEIRQGKVFINNKNADQNLNLIHIYSVDSLKFKSLKNDGYLDDNTIGGRISANVYKIGIEDKVAVQYGLINKRLVEKEEVKNETVFKVYNQNWNKDNFGELIIPKGKYFVIGDHRDNSEDSRYIGLIDQKDLVGVVIKY